MADYKGLAAEIDATLEHARTRRTYRGKIGKLQSDGSITLQSGLSDKNLVWVTLNDQTREVIAALCLRVKKQINLPVVVGYNDYKRLEILGIDTAPALDAFGEAAPGFNVPDRVGEFVDEIVAEKNIPPRVYPAQAGGLYVTVAPFDWDGGWWPGGDLLLTVPATASKKAWCVVCLKTSDNTLAQITGAEYSLAYTLTHSELAATTITSGYIPLWGFVLANSSTVVLGVQNEPLRYLFARRGASNAPVTVNVTEVGNVGAGEDDLITYSIPASTLSVNLQYLRWNAAGSFAASANNKRLRVYLGATVLFDTGVLAITAASDWMLDGLIIREGAAVQKCTARLTCSDASVAASADYVGATEDLTTALTFKLTGEATSNNDVVQELLTMEKYG